MTETPAVKAALTRREQRKLAREKNTAAAAAQQTATTPEEIKSVQPVPPKPAPSTKPRAEQRAANVAAAAADAARVPEQPQVDFEAFRSRKPTLHELNKIARDTARVHAEEAKVVGTAAAKAAHNALLGLRTAAKPDAYAAKAAAQAAMDAVRAAAASKTE